MVSAKYGIIIKMKIIRGIYTGYCLAVFSILFAIFFWPLLVPILNPSKHRWVGIINRIWARVAFTLVALPWKIEYRQPLDPNRQYIFCPNHFSYLDIPAMGLNKLNAIFVGKSDMVNIPWFGWMYRKLHITVDRTKLMSKFNTFKRSIDAIEEGKSLIYFPEGGIITEREPAMSPFKDGAFRVAIEKHVPIIPVTIPNNWIILPPNEFLLRWGKVRMIFHEPIDTKGLTMNDMDELKLRVYQTIEAELKKHINYADYERTT